MQKIGMCFVEREDWLEYCKISGSHRCDDSDYEAHVSKMERLCKELAEKGEQVVKITVKPSELLEWCTSHNLEANSIGRAEYVAERLAAMEDLKDPPG